LPGSVHFGGRPINGESESFTRPVGVPPPPGQAGLPPAVPMQPEGPRHAEPLPSPHPYAQHGQTVPQAPPHPRSPADSESSLGIPVPAEHPGRPDLTQLLPMHGAYGQTSGAPAGLVPADTQYGPTADPAYGPIPGQPLDPTSGPLHGPIPDQAYGPPPSPGYAPPGNFGPGQPLDPAQAQLAPPPVDQAYGPHHAQAAGYPQPGPPAYGPASEHGYAPQPGDAAFGPPPGDPAFAPPPGDPAFAPPPGDPAFAPPPGDPTYGPQPGEHGYAPQPGDPGYPQQGEPAFGQTGEHAYVPQPGDPHYPPGEHGYAPQPGEHGYAPQPGEHGYAPQPGEHGYAPQPGEHGYAPQPGDPGYAPQPGEHGYPPQPGEPGYPQPADPNYGPSPAGYAATPAQIPQQWNPQQYPAAYGPPPQPSTPAVTQPRPEGPTPTADDFARRRATRPSEPVATMGMRGAITKGTLGLVTLTPGRHEQEYRHDVEMVRRNFGGLRQVTVVNPKGGAGKTVAVLLLAMTFGQKRGGYVLAWDNNETQGTLGMRALQDFHTRTVRDLLRDLDHFRGAQGRVGDLSQYVRAQGEGMFDVLASDESATAGEMLNAYSFGEIREVVSRFYKLIMVDTGNNVRAQNWQAAIDATDQLVVTMSGRNDSAETAARMLDHLEQQGRHRLVRQAVTVVSMPPSRRDLDIPAISRHFAARTRTVLLAPYERFIDSGEPIRYPQLSSATRNAWLKIASAVAEGL
jgi:MinD-like ATPase involved in chromosome partitioning or flagellar assembly